MIFASWFDILIVQPIFNLLVFIYGVLPGHNFGLSIILFTIIIRLLMWPLIKKQLHQAKAMRELQPEIKRIKKASKGNRQQEQVLMMELYKEREINPFGSIGTLVVQLVILIGLYSGLTKVINNPQAIIDFAYSWMNNLPWLKELASDIGKFDSSLFGVVDLSRAAINKDGGFYLPALALVLGSAAAQYYQGKQLVPNAKDSRKLKDILKDANSGKKADQSEVSAAIGGSMYKIIPIMIIVFTINIASALSLYWMVGAIVAYMQQAKILNQDEQEMEIIADQPTKRTIIEGEIISNKSQKNKNNTSRKNRKRRK